MARRAGPGLGLVKKRRDFLAAARARKAGAHGFMLQARERGEGDAAAGPRVGFTASKKVGGAVARNRAKRRLRAIAREVLAPAAREGWDYVLIARRDATARVDFAKLKADLAAALAKAHGDRGRRP